VVFAVLDADEELELGNGGNGGSAHFIFANLNGAISA
jgi:hypothetical protein